MFVYMGPRMDAPPADPHEGSLLYDEPGVRAYVEFITGDPIVARIYLQIAVGGGLTDEAMGRRVLGHHEDRTARFADAIDRADPGQTVGDTRQQAQAMLATLNGLAFHWLLDQSLDFAGHAARLVGAAAPG